MKEILQNQSDKRVSADAADKLARLLQQKTEELAEIIVDEAAAHNRVTVRRKDVRAVIRNAE
jgi:histone H3/H4